jgi:hypothetical protein
MKGTENLGHPGTNGRIILKWILKKQGVRVWIRFIQIVTGSDGKFL